MTTKREKLTQQLLEKEKWLEQARQAQFCNCPCHKPHSEILHFEACCAGKDRNISTLESEIQILKKKLRKS